MVTPYSDGRHVPAFPRAQGRPHTHTGGSNLLHLLHPTWRADLSVVPSGDPDFAPVRVVCHALFPWCSPGDVIVCDTTGIPEVGDPVLVEFKDGGLIVGRLCGYSDDCATLEPVTASDVGLCLPRTSLQVVRPVAFVLGRRWVPSREVRQ